MVRKIRRDIERPNPRNCSDLSGNRKTALKLQPEVQPVRIYKSDRYEGRQELVAGSSAGQG